MPILTFEKPKCKSPQTGQPCCPLSPHGYGAVKADVPGITIMPGANVLSKEQFELLSKDSIFQHRITTGTYVVDSKSPDAIRSVDSVAAIAIVKETLDIRVLRRWMVEETRKDVREVIDAQIENVKPPPETKPEAKK